MLRPMETSERDCLFAGHILLMAKQMKIKRISMGDETGEQVELIKRLGRGFARGSIFRAPCRTGNLSGGGWRNRRPPLYSVKFGSILRQEDSKRVPGDFRPFSNALGMIEAEIKTILGFR